MSIKTRIYNSVILSESTIGIRGIPRDNPPCFRFVKNKGGLSRMWTIAKIFPPAAGFWNVLTPFLNVSAHFEVQIFFGLRPKKIL